MPAPVESMLVGDFHEFSHAAFLSQQSRDSIELVPLVVHIESRAPGVIFGGQLPACAALPL